MHSLRTRAALAPRGVTIVDVVVVIAVVTLLLCVTIPVAASVGTMSGDAVSLSNLRAIAVAHEAYAKTFNDRQVTWIPEDAGVVNGSCQAYITTIACPPPVILGTGTNGATWGYFLNGGLCNNMPGGCWNWVAYKPLSFSGADGGFGSFRLTNADAFNNFLDGHFYSDLFYSPNDQAAFRRSAQFRDQNIDFSSNQEEIAFSTYCLSPAAMYHPDVLSNAFGGFRDPNTFVEGYVSPTVSQCAHPDLKTRTIEHSWTRTAPAYANGNFAGYDEGFYFNASSQATPLSMFFDGHVTRLANTQAIADDEALFRSNGQRLWSRTTPFGSNGYYGAQAFDSSPHTSHTILTIDGILGRDVLTPR